MLLCLSCREWAHSQAAQHPHGGFLLPRLLSQSDYLIPFQRTELKGFETREILHIPDQKPVSLNCLHSFTLESSSWFLEGCCSNIQLLMMAADIPGRYKRKPIWNPTSPEQRAGQEGCRHASPGFPKTQAPCGEIYPSFPLCASGPAYPASKPQVPQP